MSRRRVANAANFSAMIEDVAGERIGLSQSPVRHKIGLSADCLRR
jgi:hypothetical protein